MAFPRERRHCSRMRSPRRWRDGCPGLGALPGRLWRRRSPAASGRRGRCLSWPGSSCAAAAGSWPRRRWHTPRSCSARPATRARCPRSPPRCGASCDSGAPESAAEPLSPAELAVLRLLPHRTVREMGEALYLSANTIKSHIRAIYRKLGVHTREDAVARAVALGLLDEARAR